MVLTEPNGKIRLLGVRLTPEETASLAAGRGIGAGRLIVYSTTWCGDCRTTKRVLQEAAAPFSEIDLDRDRGAEALVLQRSGGRRVVPTLQFDGRLWAFNPAAADAAPPARRRREPSLAPSPQGDPRMKIAVCIKQVPNTEARLRVRRDGRWVEEEDLPFIINESDEYALEEGLRLAEKTGGEVVVFSLGPERVKEALRKALAVGAARAVHLVDPAFGGGDALATGRALAAALARDSFDLVLTGSQSDDVGYGGTGAVLAGELGWPHVWLVMGVELEEGNASVKVTREMESGVNEVSRVQLPAVLEVQAGINHPRYASLKGIMAAKKKEIATATPADLGLDPAQVGEAGSRLEILSVSFPESGKGAQMLAGDAKAAAAQLVEKLQKEARVL